MRTGRSCFAVSVRPRLRWGCFARSAAASLIVLRLRRTCCDVADFAAASLIVPWLRTGRAPTAGGPALRLRLLKPVRALAVSRNERLRFPGRPEGLRYILSGPFIAPALVESRPRIFMLATRAPVAPTFLPDLRLLRSRSRRFRRLPQSPAREPFHDDIFIRPSKLHECRQKIFGVLRAERRGSVIDQNGPVGEARWHANDCTVVARDSLP